MSPDANPYGPDGKLTTPFYLNIYDVDGRTSSSINPVATRRASIEAMSMHAPLNSRVRVVRVNGLRDRSVYDWD